MKPISATQTILEDNQLNNFIKLMPEKWHLKIILYFYKDVNGYSWGQIFTKIGCVTEEGKPDMQKGTKYRMLYYRFKKNMEVESIRNVKNTGVNEEKADC